MRRLALSVVGISMALVLLSGCGWFVGHQGTGEPEWRFPETYIDYPNDAPFVTLDEGGVARVGDIPSRGTGCAATNEKNVSGEGTWEATGYGKIRIEVDSHVILVESGVYRGDVDWGRLFVTSCQNTVDEAFFVLYHTGYLMGP